MRVEVAYAPEPGAVDRVDLVLAPGATLAQAVRASGLIERHGLDPAALPPCGVWSKIKPADHGLRDGDRVEIYRPLKVDPKEARRQRYRRKR